MMPDDRERQTLPTLSVVMPNYNHARFLRDSLPALLSQTWRPTEITVIDDASTDDSMQVLEDFARREPRLRVIRNPKNLGMNGVLNAALDLATSDFVYFPGADDMILPTFLEECMRLLARHPQAGLCSTLTRVIDQAGHDRGVLPSPVVSATLAFIPPATASKLLMTIGNWMQGNATMYRREALIAAGGFLPEIHSFHDAFAAQVIALKHGACFVPEPLAVWRQVPGSYSVNVTASLHLEEQMILSATRLMTTRYGELFPRGYARQWRQEMLFQRERRACWARYAQQRRNLERWIGRLPRITKGVRMLYLLGTGTLKVITLARVAYALLTNLPVQTARRHLSKRLGWRLKI